MFYELLGRPPYTYWQVNKTYSIKSNFSRTTLGHIYRIKIGLANEALSVSLYQSQPDIGDDEDEVFKT